MKEMMQGLLRRPLCLLTLSYMIVAFLLQNYAGAPLSGAADRYEETLQGTFGQEAGAAEYAKVSLTGQLKKKESKNGHQIYYLKHIQIQIIEIQNSNEKSKQNVNLTKKKTQQEAVCYMAVNALEHLQPNGSSVEKDIPIGRWLYVCGEVMPTQEAENDGQFDAKAYDESRGVAVKLWDTRVLQQGRTHSTVDDALVNIKYGVAKKFHAYLSEENAGVLCAMLLGDKTSLVSEIKNLYHKSGIAHVLAISGLHISLLGMLLYRFLRRCYVPPFLCGLIGMAAVMVYIRFAGASVSSARAVSMFVLYLAADLLGRTYDLLSALSCSALLLLLQKPTAMFEAGCLLSYLAVLGLALVLPVLAKPQQKGKCPVPGWKKFVEHGFLALLPGFSVQILIFPVTLWFYYEFPMYSFLLNLIVVPCMSVVLVSGMLGAFPGMGFVLYLTDFLLECYEWLCRRTENLPGALVVTGRPEIWQIVLYYGAILVWLVVCYQAAEKEKKKEEGKEVCNTKSRACRIFTGRVVRIVYPLVCMAMFLLPVHRENRLDMLSVGQGDCICLQDASGNVVLIDGGSTDVKQAGEYRLLPFLKYHGISEVDAVFLSHAHEDHVSAIAEVLGTEGKEGVRIRTLFLSATAGESYQELIALANRAGCEVVYVQQGTRISCGEMKFDCVYPPPDASPADENDNSMVLLARLKEFSVLFTGDSSMACEDVVIQRLSAMGVEKIDCLKVSHHGAQSATGRNLLEAFDFELALISCGTGNSYGHPHAALLERLFDAGCEVYVTAESGQITVRIDDEAVRVREFR